MCIAEVYTSEGPLEAEVSIADGERVASSQGSEVFNPALHMKKMIQLHAPGEILPRPMFVPESALTTPITPATFKVRDKQYISLWHYQINSLNSNALPVKSIGLLHMFK